MTHSRLSAMITAALCCGLSSTGLFAQQSAQALPAPVASTPAAVSSAPGMDMATLLKTPALTEDELRTRFTGKVIFLRGSYLGQELNFDKDGRITGSPAVGSFTLSAFEVRKVTLTKTRLELEADRYGLHYLGALPFDDDSKTYDRVKISEKPVHISIEREVIIIPKAKKEKKKKKDQPTPEQLAAAQTLKPRDAAAPATATTGAAAPAPALKATPGPAAAAETAEALATVAPAHSAMMMNKALDNIFAGDLDPRMMAQLPDYWQDYFASKKAHKAFMPADHNIRALSDGMTPPRVLNRIDPSSNEFAQQYGIAGMELLRTVIDASGSVKETAIARPIGFGLDEKAVEAVKTAHFQPAMVNGQPVPVVIDLVVTFRIYSNRTKPGSVAASVAKTGTETTLAAAADMGTSGSATIPR